MVVFDRDIGIKLPGGPLINSRENVIESPEFDTPPKITPRDPAFGMLLDGLASLDRVATVSHDKNVREVIEHFLENQRGTSNQLPWVEAKNNPLRINIPPCYHYSLRIEERPTGLDKHADTAYIPYAPPIEYLKDPPTKLAHTRTELQRNIRMQLYLRGYDHLDGLARVDPEYAQVWPLKQAGQDPDLNADIMVTWAEDQAMKGVDKLRSLKHSERLSRRLEEVEGDTIHILSPQELRIECTSSIYELNDIHSDIQRYYDNPIYTIQNYNERVQQTFDRLEYVIDMCRWHLEQETPYTPAEISLLCETLTKAYKGYHTILQTCNSEEPSVRDQVFHDVSTLLAGNKIDQDPFSSYKDNFQYTGEADYVDAFMAVATNYEVSLDYIDLLLKASHLGEDRLSCGRSYFGDFLSAGDTQRQQLTLMCILFFRMPEWQQNVYSELIINAIDDIERRAHKAGSDKTEAKTLYVPSASRLHEIQSVEVPFNMTEPKEVYAAGHVLPFIELMEHRQDPIMETPTGRLEISLTPTKKIKNKDNIYFTQDRLEFLHPEKRVAHEEEIKDEEDPAFALLARELQDLPPRPSSRDPGYAEYLAEQRAIIERFVRERTGTSDKFLPWLEQRLNPPPLDMPTCYSMPLPEEYIKHDCDMLADHAMIPQIPPLEYLLSPPANQYKYPADEKYDPSPIDFQINLLAVDALAKTFAGKTEYQTARSRMGTWENVASIYATWAQATRIDGVDQMRSEVHSRELTSCFQHNTIVPADERSPVKKENSNDFTIIIPSDLPEQSVRVKSKLDSLLEDIGHKIDDDNFHIPNYTKRQRSILFHVRNIIDVARWHLDHETLEDPQIREFNNRALVDAYKTYNTLLQTCNSRDDDTHLYGDFHDLQTLIAGEKIDQSAEGLHGQATRFLGRVDYFDAFMAVSQASDVAIRYGEVAGGLDQPHTTSHEGARPLLGTFEAQAKGINQQILLMTVLYYRMSDWQKQTYQEIIQEQFDRLTINISPSAMAKEPQIFVPTASSAPFAIDDGYTAVNFADPDDIRAYNYLYPIIELSRPELADYIEKPTAHIEASKRNAAKIIGFNNAGAWTDEWGFVHPGNESHVVKEMEEFGMVDAETSEVELVAPQPQESWLEVLARNAESYSLESRVGKEAAEKIRELVETDPANGSAKSVADFSKMLERLLGRTPTESENNFVGLLQEIGMINAETGRLQELNATELEEALHNLRTNKPELGDLDESSLMLLLLGCSGVVPREELAAEVIKAYQSLESVLVMEAATALDAIDQRTWLRKFFKKRKEPNVILTSRQQLKDFVAAKKAENPAYDPNKDPEWQEMAKGIVSRVVKLMTDNKSYDATMKSSLYAVVTAKEKGKLVARCYVDGQLLTAFLRFISPELVTYNTEMYGRESLMSLVEWYQFLESADESGGESHGYNQTDFQTSVGRDIHVGDATGNSSYTIPSESIQVVELPKGTLKYAELTLQSSPHIYGDQHQRYALGQCITGGSSLLEDLARQAHQIDYQKLANPDSPMLWEEESCNEDLPPERRAEALDRLLLVTPYRLAMSPKIDYANGAAALSLQRVVELARETNRWGGAFFAANILARAHFFSEDIQRGGQELRRNLAHIVAARGEGDYHKILQDADKFLVQEDRQLITAARAEYLAELARQARERQLKQEEIEREMRQKYLEQAQQKLENTLGETRMSAAIQMRMDSEREEEDQKRAPALGRTATREISHELKEQVKALTEKTVTQFIPNELFDNTQFEYFTEETQRAHIQAAITGPDGHELTGDALTRRLRLIQTVFVMKAYELTRGEEANVPASALQNYHEDRVQELAEALNNQFQKVAESMQLPVPDFDPQRMVSNESIRKQLHG